MSRPTSHWSFLFLALGSLSLAGCGGKVDLKFVGAPDTSSCGDETVDADEKCDDGNTEDGDGCSKECQPEEGYVCVGKKNSSCAKTCGNDKLDTGETCEDGNTTKGDGCDASCQMEGSCSEPLPLVFENGVATIDGSTASGGGGVDAADCGGENAGAGPDRVYQIEITETSDVTISLSSSFNALIRFQDAACDLDGERGCVNTEGAGGDETLTFRDVTPGAYFVVVDGANSSASGDFTLTVRTSCPVSNLKLDRIYYRWQGIYYDTGYQMAVQVRNVSKTCALKLDQFFLSVDSGGNSLGSNVKLANTTLGAGKTHLISAGPNPLAQQKNAGFYMDSSASRVMLCRGQCSTEDPSNTLDAFLGGYTNGSNFSVAFPDGIEMTPKGLERFYNSTTSERGVDFGFYYRAKTVGKYPSFRSSDWSVAVEINPDLALGVGISGLSSVYASGCATSPSYSVADVPDEGKVINLATGAANCWQGQQVTMPYDFKPAAISYRTKVDSGYQSFQLSTGGDTDPYDAWVLQSYRWTTGIRFQEFDSLAVIPPYGTWFDIEIAADWSAATFTGSMDGVEYATDESFTNTLPIEKLQVIQYYTGETSSIRNFVAVE